MTEQDMRDGMRRRLLGAIHDDLPGRDGEAATATTRASSILNKIWPLMRARLLVGHFRYGRHVEKGARYDAVGSAITRLQRYKRDGNQEDLVDAANLCAVELWLPQSHPNPHFESADDGDHVEEIA